MEVTKAVGLVGKTAREVAVLRFGSLADVAGDNGKTRAGVGLDVGPAGADVLVEAEVWVAVGGGFGEAETGGIEAVVLGAGTTSVAAEVVGTLSEAWAARVGQGCRLVLGGT